MEMTTDDLELMMPYYSENTVGENLAERFDKLKAILENNDTSSLINQKTLTGIWYLAGLHHEEDDNHPQIIVRSPLASDTHDRMLVDAAISGCIYADMVYDYDRDYIGGDADELLPEVREHRVYTIFDKERPCRFSG